MNGFCRLKRSTSQEVVMGSEGGFKRGGVRATAGPRLGGGAKLNRPENKSDNFLTPFSQWTSDQVGRMLDPYTGSIQQIIM